MFGNFLFRMLLLFVGNLGFGHPCFGLPWLAVPGSRHGSLVTDEIRDAHWFVVLVRGVAGFRAVVG